jgi:hypothetical protein
MPGCTRPHTVDLGVEAVVADNRSPRATKAQLAAVAERGVYEALCLRADLLALAATIDAAPALTTEHGERWVGSGELRGPSGAPLPVVTVWLIPSGRAPPRLITAYPTAPL